MNKTNFKIPPKSQQHLEEHNPRRTSGLQTESHISVCTHKHSTYTMVGREEEEEIRMAVSETGGDVRWVHKVRKSNNNK